MIVRRILKIDFDADSEGTSFYTVGMAIRREYQVKDISFRRDGYSGIYKDGRNEAHYLIRLENELNDKETTFILIPKAEAKKITFQEEDVETKKEELKLERV